MPLYSVVNQIWLTTAHNERHRVTARRIGRGRRPAPPGGYPAPSSPCESPQAGQAASRPAETEKSRCLRTCVRIKSGAVVSAAQGNLFALGPVEVRRTAEFDRTDLGEGAWVDVARGWLGGADELVARLEEEVDWRHHRRWMYDRMVDEPRLTRWYSASEPLPEEALAWFRVAVGRRYKVRFGAMGLNYYRDGHDSVASHSDRELRQLDDTLVAIVTLGAARPFLLRPQGGGKSIDLRPASGDLLVMGGTCQETWEHGVPKVASGAGPRISASIRWANRLGPEQEWAPPERYVTGVEEGGEGSRRPRRNHGSTKESQPARRSKAPGVESSKDARKELRVSSSSAGDDQE